MTLKEPDTADNSAIAEFIRECGETAAKGAPTKRYPKRRAALKEIQTEFDLFPSPHESAAAQRYLERRADPDAKSQMTFRQDEESGAVRMISADHDKDHVAARLVAMDSFSTGYYEFSNAMLDQLRSIATDRFGIFDAGKLSQAMAMIQGISPQNELEAMLAVQMVAVQLGTMKAGEAAATAQMREHQHWANSSLAKLARTFAAQVDSLRNLRLNGAQHHHVYHHRVNEVAPEADPERRSHESSSAKQRNQTRQSPQSAALQREIKKISKGLPRPRDARS
ncbi:MAG: hypothetical protein QM780_06870 [Hyphomicrobium sp.]|uniref:hypothetical protein n=1 Tax=Hyphomicrobium sp. TaxID=82 RepID=UPI0039E5E921